MAQETDRGKDDLPAGGASVGDFIKSALVAILVGAGGGAALGYFVIPDGAATPAKQVSEVSEARGPATGRFPNDALEIPIPPVIVDLISEPRTKVRLDLSIIAAHGTPETGSLKNEVREDVIAFLKGSSVNDIQGVRGFQNLREQLDDRAKIRGRGAILGLLIGGLVLE
jgi:flagellar FliL protein